MTAILFDTHQFVQELKSADFTEKQAEAVARAFKNAQSESQLASKADIERLEIKLGAELNLLKWMVGGLVALAVANFARQFF